MINRLRNQIKENSSVQPWGITALAALLGLFCLLFSWTYLAVGLLAFAAGWTLNTWLIGQVFLIPLREIIAKGEAIISRDSTLFSDALVSLSQGNLTTRLALQSTPLPQPDSTELQPVVNLLNTIQATLQESAKEFNAITDEPCRRLFYVGADPYLEGRACGEIIGQAMGGQGQVLIITMDLSFTSMALRCKGFEGLLREKYPHIRVTDILENDTNPQEATVCTREYLAKNPNINGIYVTDGGNPPGVAKAVVEAGLSGKIKIVSHDLVDETMQYLSQGVITATLGQDPFAQGHDPVIHLFNHLVTGWRPETPRILTAQDVITPENYQNFWKAGVGAIETQAISERRARPIKPASKPLRIAVIGRNESAFWEPVEAGVKAAANELQNYNATVEWIVPDWENRLDIAARMMVFDLFVEQGFDAIALDIQDPTMIPYINRAVANGVAVAIFNGEPSSLRSLLNMIADRAKSLLTVSRELASAAHKVGGEGQRNNALAALENGNIVMNITQAINAVAADAQEQANNVEKVSMAINQIAEATIEMVHNISAVSDAASSSALTAKQGTDTVQQILTQIQNIQNSVEITAEAIRDMSTFSQKIGEINITIKEFTDQTSLLALNASIVAAGANDSGKGFTVIANEIRDLAEKSAVATREVNAIIQAVQKSIRRATESMEVAMRRVSEGSILASTSGQALDELLAAAEAMQQQTLPLVSTSSSVKDAISRLCQANERVSGVIAENITATEEISATTQELAVQTRQVSSSAALLNGIARELEGSIAVFKIVEKINN